MGNVYLLGWMNLFLSGLIHLNTDYVIMFELIEVLIMLNSWSLWKYCEMKHIVIWCYVNNLNCCLHQKYIASQNAFLFFFNFTVIYIKDESRPRDLTLSAPAWNRILHIEKV